MTDNQDRIAADPNKVDAIKLSLMLTELRLPTFNQLWQGFAKRADAEGWTAARFLATLLEHELAERDRRRIERHLRQARLLPGKTLDAFDFSVVPMISKAQVNALAAGDAWPGRQLPHLRAARRRQEPFGVRHRARRERIPRPLHPNHRSRPAPAGRPPRTRPRSHAREARPLPPPDPRRHRLCPEGPGPASSSNLSQRATNGDPCSSLQTSPSGTGTRSSRTKQPRWLPRLVHHATILEMNVESYRRREALDRSKRKRGRPAKHATGKNTAD